MSQALNQVPFSEGYRVLPAVQNFDCGSESWQVEIAKWLRRSKGAAKAPSHPDIKKRCDVWLYLTTDDELVGFGSLGGTVWTLSEGPTPISIIPYLAIDKAFWGCPKGASHEERYSTLIMKSLIAEAEQACGIHGREPFLGLYVHPQNEQAKQLYLRMGFEPFERESDGYESMLRVLS